ncbi:Wzt carbohydrate-binding domain-containing protein, partial [Ligilactobacillus salivarius]|uniref:Wzt carbohydrate-binding domain-containing protein n=1 Tax=Ligilactobacillus salivarius TaxID=1624 RepID=UPI003C2AF576
MTCPTCNPGCNLPWAWIARSWPTPCDARNVRFGMLIKTPTGVELGGATSAKQIAEGIGVVSSGSVLSVEYSFVCRLNEGLYFL